MAGAGEFHFLAFCVAGSPHALTTLENSLEFHTGDQWHFQQLSSQYPDYRYYSVIRGGKGFQ